MELMHLKGEESKENKEYEKRKTEGQIHKMEFRRRKGGRK
jgi:hypothetical protein